MSLVTTSSSQLVFLFLNSTIGRRHLVPRYFGFPAQTVLSWTTLEMGTEGRQASAGDRGLRFGAARLAKLRILLLKDLVESFQV